MSATCAILNGVDTPARLLRLLVMFSSRATWKATELAHRLEVTERTLRRDVTRLRDLGYPINTATGPYGGYSLGAGGRLPPLLLDDDEAVAVTVALQTMAREPDPVLGEAGISALTKLAQVLPSGLRERVGILGEMVVHTDSPSGTGQVTNVATLLAVATACRASERLRFDYERHDHHASRRHVEPHRLVTAGRRWYLVGFDLERDDWRTFRVDRISAVANTGQRSTPRPAPDPSQQVTTGLAIAVYDQVSVIRFLCPPAEVAQAVRPSIGIIEPTDAAATSTVVRIGGELRWTARYVLGLDMPFEVIEPDELNDEFRRLARRLLRQHPATRSRSGG